MRRVLLALALLGLAAGANADPDPGDPANLEGGVLIAHAPAGFVYSAGLDYCAEYDAQYSLSGCDDQVNTMPIGASSADATLFYVVAAFNGDKIWCGTEFGIGSGFNGLWYFTEYGPCLTNSLENATGGWPGADQGTVVIATDTRWEGNFLAAYYFIGYGYSESTIPLGLDPAQDFAGTGNCLVPAIAYDAECLGVMGIGVAGEYCCPGDGEPEAACCTDGVCTVVTETVCTNGGGMWYASEPDCVDFECPAEWACCFGDNLCQVRTLEDCDAISGVWHPDFHCPGGGAPEYNCAATGIIQPCCYSETECTMEYMQECLNNGGDFYESWDDCDQDPCITPTHESTWGSIKTIYR